MTAPDAVSKAPYQKIRGFCFMQIKKHPSWR
nr:MAG TPA: hypothetical protein [Caudoviricetes sp.]